jgi:hypothetical protein
MQKDIKSKFLGEINRRLGKTRKMGGSQSLYSIDEYNVRLYLRYSRPHPGGRTWYGLREIDLRQLEGFNSFLCFLWDGQEEPLIIPYSEYEEVFQTATPAEDGQYKVQIILNTDNTELYLARVGRFNVEGFFGWEHLESTKDTTSERKVPDLSHSQIQTLLGSIGLFKNYEIWIPPSDRIKLDWTLCKEFSCTELLPYGFEDIRSVIHEVDVIWLQRGSKQVKALFEVEHSTPVYSGLLRFNDVHLIAPQLRARFSIVANWERRSIFVRQINRPTFRLSGLNEICTFLEYEDVYHWYKRTIFGSGKND